MAFSIQLLAVSVLATAEFCSEPIEGGVGEPQFCRFSASQEVATPHFSIVVEPDFLVGVHHQGRRLQLQSTLWQSQNHLTIEILEGSTLPVWPDCREVTETVAENVTWQKCRITVDGAHERRLAARLNG